MCNMLSACVYECLYVHVPPSAPAGGAEGHQGSLHGGVCECVHPAQPTRRLWLCAAGWMKSPSGPQGMAILPWVSTQSGRPVAALPCLNSLSLSQPYTTAYRIHQGPFHSLFFCLLSALFFSLILHSGILFIYKLL